MVTGNIFNFSKIHIAVVSKSIRMDIFFFIKLDSVLITPVVLLGIADLPWNL